MYTRWLRFWLDFIPIEDQEELIQIFTALHNDLNSTQPGLFDLITFWTRHLLDIVVLSIVLHVEYLWELFLTILFWLCLIVFKIFLKVATALFIWINKNIPTNNKLYELVLMLLLTGIAVVTLLVSVIVVPRKSLRISK